MRMISSRSGNSAVVSDAEDASAYAAGSGLQGDTGATKEKAQR
jgi:hypothetical protein